MDALQSREVFVSELAVRDDNEIAVAVFVEIADRERALEIGADEAVGERGLKRADKTRQHRVQAWIGRRRSHRNRRVSNALGLRQQALPSRNAGAKPGP